MILLAHSLRRQRVLFIAACVLLFAFQILLILVARGLEWSGGFIELGNLFPAFLQELTNLAMMSFGGMVSFAYTHPVVLVFLIAMAIGIGTEPAGEIEAKFVDLALARPLPRRSAINRSIALLLVATGAALGSMLLGTWSGLLLLAPASVPGPAPRVILSLAANLALAVLAWGAIALTLGSLARRRAAAAGTTGLLALAMFILDYVGRLWEPARGLSRLSPFHYFSPFPLIGGAPLPGRDVVTLAVIFLAGCVAAHVVYARRDL